MRLPPHEATTAQLGAVYPFISSPPLPVHGILVGRDLLGGVFVHDPFDLYRVGILTNPNMVVFGQIGRGKSALVKTYLYRQVAFGRRIVVLDPKGEYGELASALGRTPVRLHPGGDLCLNPLAVTRAAPCSVGDGALRRIEIMVAIAEASLERRLLPAEHSAVSCAVEACTANDPTLTQVVDQMLDPDAGSARQLRCSVEELRLDGRPIALELRQFIRGSQRGMFDGPTSPGIDLDDDVVIVDLSAVYRSPSLAVLMTCIAAALEAGFRGDTRQTVFVIDEAWAVLGNLGAARFLQSSWKLARANGVANVAVLHRVSDLHGAGEIGSVGANIATGLLSDCETVVCYAQAHAESEHAARGLGLEPSESRLLSRLRRGVAMWRVGDRPFLVEHRISADERCFVDTDARLVGSERNGAAD